MPRARARDADDGSRPVTGGRHAPARSLTCNTVDGTVSGASIQAHIINGNVVLPPARTVTPAQLRAATPLFTNRVQELLALAELLDPAEAGPPRLVVVSGDGGAGKTALTLQWAHSVLDRFPGGQFLADLRGFSGDRSGPLEPRTVLERFLRALGIHPDYMPSDVDELAALWRSVTAGQRVLIVADNAASAHQVRPLLPGAAPAVVVVTTRRPLPELVMDGAHCLHLGPLDDASSLTLLNRVLGSARQRVDPDAARVLLTHSGRLPLTLYALCAHLSAHPDRDLATIAGGLATAHATRTETTMDDHNTGASLDLVYDALSEDEQTTYRLIGLLPGPSFTAEMIAEIDALTQEEAQRRLARLASAKLLDPESAERFTMHDRVRSHARAKAHAICARADLGDITRWIAEEYRNRAADAQRAVVPGRWYLGDCFHRPIEKTFTKQAALDWLEAELPNLLAVQQMAYDEELYPIACDITEALWGLFVYRRTHSGWLRSCEIGHQAAVAWGNPITQARVLEGFGAAYQAKQDWLTAETYFRRALVLEEQADHLVGAASALEGIGISQLGQGHHDRALAYFRRALGYHLALKRARGARLQQRHVGQAHLAAGHYRDAIAAIQECRQYQVGNEEYLEGRELLFEGQAYLGVGDLDSAEQALTRALSIAEQNKTKQEQATIGVALADLASAQGDRDHELELLQAACDVYTDLGHPQAHQVRERIESIRTTDHE